MSSVVEVHPIYSAQPEIDKPPPVWSRGDLEGRVKGGEVKRTLERVGSRGVKGGGLLSVIWRYYTWREAD